MESDNPFVFDRPLEDGRGLVGRQRELAEVLEAMQPGAELLVEGPPRHGKTSLVNAALEAWGAGERGLAVRIDCAGVLTVPDLLPRVDDAYVRARATGKLEAELVEQLQTLTFRPGPAPAPLGRAVDLDGLLSVLGNVAVLTDTPAVMVFDEFQDTLAIKAVQESLQRARGDDGGRIAHVFVGPELASRREPGGEPPPAWSERAATVAIGSVDADLFAEHIASVFEQTGREAGEAGRLLAQVGAGHPQRTSMLASYLWDLTGEGERATVPTARMAISNALRASAGELEARWQSLHSNERRVAVAIARDLAPQGTRAQRATGLAGFGAAQRAVQGVKSSGIAEQRGDGMVLIDPLFAEWLRMRYQSLAAEPDWLSLRRQAERGIERRGPTLGT